MAPTTPDMSSADDLHPIEGDDAEWEPLIQEYEAQQTVRRPLPPSTNAQDDSARRQERLREIQTRLETKSRLKKGLVDHPIGLLWSHFIVHFGRELWALDIQIRLALFFIFVGACIKVALLSTAFFWYPRLVFGPIFLLAPFLYLNPNLLQDFLSTFSSPANLADALNQLDPKQLRRVFVALLFVPTLLEMRTLQFLSQVTAESSWTVYTLVVVAALWLAMSQPYRKQGAAPRECTHRGLIVLYGGALLVTLLRFDIWRIPILAAPFFSATGVLLLTSREDDMEWFSRAVRHALRLTLRDVLASVGQSVREDEMLQLAMLRWIVDYWSNSPSERPYERASSSGSARRGMSGHGAETARANSSIMVAPRRQEIAWTELMPMLSMTTDQMAAEVHSLQDNAGASAPGVDVTEGSRLVAASRESPRRSNSARSNFDSVQNLQAMLASMDLDMRAKPAVAAYKKGVQDFPPSRNVAIVLSVARRCPAILTILAQVFFGVSWSILSTILLLPFVYFELLRTKEWSDSCKKAAPLISDQKGFLDHVDPMTILLSGDHLSMRRPPTLLVVWMNICSSVTALEKGLTAARCVQTTAVAVDFADNIMSLAHFGLEVSQRGLLHGLSVVLKELVVHYSYGFGSNPPPGQAETKYTSAALSAVHNSRRMSRNVQILMEDEHASQIIAPLLGVLSIIVGKGWLWGRDEPRPMPRSTVEIVELDDDSQDGLEIQHNTSEQPKTLSDAEPATKSGVDNKAPTTDIFVVSIRDKVASEQAEAHLVEDVSVLMELVAECAEQGLIEMPEKNSMCERLVSMKAGDSADAEWVRATKRTLNGLLDHGTDTTEAQVAEDKPLERVAGGGDMADSTTEMLAQQCVERAVDSTEPPVVSSHDKDESSHVNSRPTSPDAGGAAIADAPDDETPLSLSKEDHVEVFAPGSDARHGSSDPPVLVTEDGDDEDDDFEPLEPSQGQPPAHPLPEKHQSALKLETKTESNNNENMWVQVGGGLAVLGAVVGGVALAMRQQPSPKRRRPSLTRNSGGERDESNWESM